MLTGNVEGSVDHVNRGETYEKKSL